MVSNCILTFVIDIICTSKVVANCKRKCTIITVFLIVICSLSCNSENKNSHVTTNGISTSVKSRNDTFLILASSSDYTARFNEKDWLLYLYDKQERIQIGRYANSMGYPPEVTLTTFPEGVLVTVTQTFTTYGIDEYFINFFLFNKRTRNLKDVCTFERIHGGSYDQIVADASYYDLVIDEKKQKIVLEEYFPYRSDEHDNKYSMKVRACSWTW